MPQKLFFFIFLLSFTIFASAQNNATDNTAKPGADDAELEKMAVELLIETASDVGSLRSVENRISFNAELASLMWFHDEKQAMAMYTSVINDFRQLMIQLDAQTNSSVVDEDDEESSGGLYARFGRSAAERKMRVAMIVRQQLALSLAEHAPDLAFNFFNDSRSFISDPELRKQTEETDKYFESTLFKRIGEGSAAKAIEYGKKSLKNGLRGHHIDLLGKIYDKDAEKGIEFGADILSRLKGERLGFKDLDIYSSLLNIGSERSAPTKNGKRALFEQNDLRDIAKQFAQALLAAADDAPSYMAEMWAEQIDRFAPGKGAQIRAKFQADSGPSVPAYTSANAAANAYMAASNAVVRSEADVRADREKAEAALYESIKDVGSKPLSTEDRQKIITQARGIIARTPRKEKKIMALNLLAVQVMRAGDKLLAAEIMSDAERFVNPQPKNYRDFLLTLMVASGYAETDPDRAFPLLQDTISRVNETIAAAVKVAEFMDVTNEMVSDGEVQVGSFGGSMIRDITKELGMANSTLEALARADFTRTRGLTNAFDRTEVRVLAKMMVLRAVLQKEGSLVTRNSPNATD